MASDEILAMILPMQEDDCDDTDHDDHHSHTPNNLSRLSMCSSSLYYADDDDDVNIFMSRLSIESFDGDADEELSDEKVKRVPHHRDKELDLSSADDSDKEPGCYSLPATPPRRRSHRGSSMMDQLIRAKEYASENELQKSTNNRKSRKKRVVSRQRLKSCSNNSLSGESESGAGGGGGGVVVITRPKGGKRSLCMDLEEVKACNDLGFELEHERMLEVPGRVSMSGSTLDTASSGGNSPIANWRISSPGDNPIDVKARLKVWAQAVALASTPRHNA